MMLKALAAGLVALGLITGGCTNYSGNAYSGRQVRSVQTVQYGKVTQVRHVTLENSKDESNLLGSIGGAAVGGVLGNMVGGGHGRTLATVGGAVAGGLVGNMGQRALTKQDGLEIEVSMEDGQTLSIVQAADQMFTEGERVRILLGSDGSARVSR